MIERGIQTHADAIHHGSLSKHSASSLYYDQNVKLGLYARHRVAEMLG